MSKTHKITQLKKRIAKIEKQIIRQQMYEATRSLHEERCDIVMLKTVVQFRDEPGRPTPICDARVLQMAMNDMFNVHNHPELAQLLTCNYYLSRVDPMVPDINVHTFEISCQIVKPNNDL